MFPRGTSSLVVSSRPLARRVVLASLFVALTLCLASFNADPTSAASDTESTAFTPPQPDVLPAIADTGKPELTMSGFLDRLMLAESSGRDDARNPRSTALGAYQFIEATWLDLTRRNFSAETRSMPPEQVLVLRTDRAFARRVAEAYTRENAAILKARGLSATFPQLRLAFLLGPQGATRILLAPPQTRVTLLLGPAVARANPFMFGLTAEGLIARAARDLDVHPATLAGLAPGETPSPTRAGTAAAPRPPRVAVRCNLDLPSCRRWQSLALARLPTARPNRKLATIKAR